MGSASASEPRPRSSSSQPFCQRLSKVRAWTFPPHTGSSDGQRWRRASSGLEGSEWWELKHSSYPPLLAPQYIFCLLTLTQHGPRGDANLQCPLLYPCASVSTAQGSICALGSTLHEREDDHFLSPPDPRTQQAGAGSEKGAPHVWWPLCLPDQMASTKNKTPEEIQRNWADHKQANKSKVCSPRRPVSFLPGPSFSPAVWSVDWGSLLTCGTCFVSHRL